MNWYVEPETGEVNRENKPIELMTPNGTMKVKKAKKTFKSIGGQIQLGFNGDKYRIRPLPNNPKYILILKVYPDKFYQAGRHEEQRSHATELRYQDHKQHKKNIKEKYKNIETVRVTEESNE
tara:strand:+ start:864 stop:1229 length:366 start_codon:yes stop_codon:yes gene_type:complete